MNALITNIINNIFHMIWLCCIALEPKHSWKKTVMIMAGTSIFFQFFALILLRYMGIYTVLHDVSAPGFKVHYVIGYIVAVFIFGGIYLFVVSASHPAKSLFLLSSYFSLWTLIYLIISMVTRTVSGAGNIQIWLLRIGLNLFFLILYFSFFRKRLLRIYKEVNSGYGTVSTLSILAFIMMTFLILYNESVQNRDFLYISMIFISCGFVMMVYVMLFRYIGQSDHARRLKQMESHEELLRAQIDSYEEMEQNIRRTRHDFRHHNMVVAAYAKDGDCQGILSYLQEYEDKEEGKYTRIYCVNSAVGNVLSVYVGKAKQKGIEIDTQIELCETGEISDYDLVSILANILENAINGCIQTDGDREIGISIRNKDKKLILICHNTCLPDIVFKNGRPQNKNRDNVGIESILNSVEKYSGDVDFCIKDGKFFCRVILNTFSAKNRRR